MICRRLILGVCAAFMKGQTVTELRAEDDRSVSVRVHASHKNSTHILTLVSLSVQLYAANDGWHFLSLMKVFEATRWIVNQGEKVMMNVMSVYWNRDSACCLTMLMTYSRCITVILKYQWSLIIISCRTESLVSEFIREQQGYGSTMLLDVYGSEYFAGLYELSV